MLVNLLKDVVELNHFLSSFSLSLSLSSDENDYDFDLDSYDANRARLLWAKSLSRLRTQVRLCAS